VEGREGTAGKTDSPGTPRDGEKEKSKGKCSSLGRPKGHIPCLKNKHFSSRVIWLQRRREIGPNLRDREKGREVGVGKVMGVREKPGGERIEDRRPGWHIRSHNGSTKERKGTVRDKGISRPPTSNPRRMVANPEKHQHHDTSQFPGEKRREDEPFPSLQSEKRGEYVNKKIIWENPRTGSTTTAAD